MKFPQADVLLAFKNGNTVIRKTIELKKDQKVVTTNMPSSAIHGTVWITSKGAKIKSTKSTLSKRPKESLKDCTSILEILKANIGKEVKINQKVIKYVIKNVLDNGSKTGLVVLTDNEKVETFVPIKDISVVQSSSGEELNKKIVEKEDVKEIEIHYETIKEDKLADMYYLMKNFTWAPSYFLFLNSEKKLATLRMQSTIINDAENVFAKKFICAAGSPKNKFEHVQDPFVTGQSMQSFFSSLTSGGNSMRFNRAPPQQFMMSNIMQQQRVPTMPTSSSNAPSDDIKGGSNATDYYYYTFENVSVGKTQRIVLPIFEMNDMKYKEIYKCSLAKQSDPSTPLKTTHCVRIVNTSDFIWTTGPCTITSDKQDFAGQDQIYFTPKGIHNLVEIADALSINVKYSESVELKKKEKQSFYGSRYVKAFVTCQVEITNYQEKDILIMTDASFVGEMQKSTQKCSSKNTELNQSVDSPVVTKCEWETEVKKNETQKYEFVYSKWVRDRNY